MTRVTMPSRRTGKTLTGEARIDGAVLALLFDGGGSMLYTDLCRRIPLPRRALLQSLSRQYTLGNVKRRHDDEPIELTSSARIAIAAGRQGIRLISGEHAG